MATSATATRGRSSVWVASIQQWTAGTARSAMYGLRNHIQSAANTSASDVTQAAPGAAGLGGSLPARRTTRDRSTSQASAVAATTRTSVTTAPESSFAWFGSRGAGGAS